MLLRLLYRLLATSCLDGSLLGRRRDGTTDWGRQTERYPCFNGPIELVNVPPQS
jgi:hypothetical protein